MKEAAISFRVTGRVQGVAFRAFVQKTAQGLGLNGWVKNHPDGSVYGECEGDAGLLQEFVKQVKIGSTWSAVRGFEVSALPFSGECSQFDIRY